MLEIKEDRMDSTLTIEVKNKILVGLLESLLSDWATLSDVNRYNFQECKDLTSELDKTHVSHSKATTHIRHLAKQNNVLAKEVEELKVENNSLLKSNYSTNPPSRPNRDDDDFQAPWNFNEGF